MPQQRFSTEPKKKVRPPLIRPSIFHKITPNEKWMLRMRALAHDSVLETREYDFVIKANKLAEIPRRPETNLETPLLDSIEENSFL